MNSVPQKKLQGSRLYHTLPAAEGDDLERPPRLQLHETPFEWRQWKFYDVNAVG
jgi:hypothetical protein